MKNVLRAALLILPTTVCAQGIAPSPVSVPRGHISAWKPFAGNMTVDTAGATMGNRTISMVFEIPDDATAAQVIFANTTASTWDLSSAAIWGSSQFAVSGYTGTGPGITPYDASGAALTTMSLLSFGNNGVDSAPKFGLFQAAPTNSVNLTTNASSSGTTLNFAGGITCPPLGSTVATTVTAATSIPQVYPATYVTACNSGAGTITVNQALRVTIPITSVVYFIPPGFTMPATGAAAFPSFTYSDWVPMQTYDRLDGPIMSGMTVLRDGSPIGAVSSVTATTATLDTSLASVLPAGSTLQACRSGVTNATTTPTMTLQFATNANIKQGMVVARNNGTGNPFATNADPYWPDNSVASVVTGANTTVTLAKSLPYSSNSNTWNSATTFQFMTPVTTTASTSTSSATLTVNDTSQLSTGMTVFQGNSTGGIGGTISSITDGTHVVMSQNVTATVPSGQALYFKFNANTNASATSTSYAGFSTVPANLFPGMSVVGQNISSGATMLQSLSGNVYFSGPTTGAGIVSGATVYFCNTVVTSTSSASGQTDLNFVSTTWPNRLVILRVNLPAGAASSLWATTHADPGLWTALSGRRFTSYYSANGVDGVLNVAAMGNGTSTGVLDWYPVLAVKFYSPKNGLTFMTVGDSHAEGDTTTAGNANYVARLTWALNKTSMPTTHVNAAWGGTTSSIYGQYAKQMIDTFQPDVVFVQNTTPNNGTGNFAYAAMTQVAQSIAAQVQAYGGLPVLTADYQRQLYGVTLGSPTLDAYRVLGRTGVLSVGTSGAAVFDPTLIMGDPVNGSTWLNPQYSSDGVHGNDAGHAAMAIGARAAVCSFIRC